MWAQEERVTLAIASPRFASIWNCIHAQTFWLAGLALALATPLYAADQPAQPDMARLNALLGEQARQRAAEFDSRPLRSRHRQPAVLSER